MQLRIPIALLALFAFALLLFPLPGSSSRPRLAAPFLTRFGDGSTVASAVSACAKAGETCFYSTDCCSGLCQIHGNICVSSEFM